MRRTRTHPANEIQQQEAVKKKICNTHPSAVSSIRERERDSQRGKYQDIL